MLLNCSDGWSLWMKASRVTNNGYGQLCELGGITLAVAIPFSFAEPEKFLTVGGRCLLCSFICEYNTQLL